MEGPSFLSAPPVVPPDPDGKRTLIVPVSASPYRELGELPKPKAPPVRRDPTPRRDPILEAKREVYVEPIGDRAGEHLIMKRGEYGAWFYVAWAFFFQVILIGALPLLLLGEVLPFGDIGRGIGLLIGLVGAWWCYRDRWRCIEAFSSRFCSGIMNLSMLYVPIVAFFYANARALAKLRN